MKWAPELAEAIGTYALVLVGCGAIIATQATGTPGPVGIALAFGLVVGGMIYATGHVSGAHFNPAVTIAFVVGGHFPARRAATYMGAQLAGGLLATATLWLVFDSPGDYGQTAVSPSLTGPWAGFLLEVLQTAFLMFVIASVATDGRAVGRLAGSAIGGTVALNALWAGPLTGASMNPVRSLAPFLFAGAEGPIWIYLAGPVLGAVLGALAYEAIRPGLKPEGRKVSP